MTNYAFNLFTEILFFVRSLWSSRRWTWGWLCCSVELRETLWDALLYSFSKNFFAIYKHVFHDFCTVELKCDILMLFHFTKVNGVLRLLLYRHQHFPDVFHWLFQFHTIELQWSQPMLLHFTTVRFIFFITTISDLTFTERLTHI